MSKRIYPLLATLTLGLSIPANCQKSPPVQEIVARHIEALGGQRNIDAIHSVVFRLTYREGDHVNSDGYMAKMRPYYKTLGDPRNLKADVNEGFDGSAWEYYSDPGVVLRVVGAAAAATRHGAELIDSLADAGMLGARIELAGEELFAGNPAYRLHVTLADGFEKDLFVDRQSFLILGDRRAAPVHAFGATVPSENRFGDYRPINGVLFPFAIREVEIATGKELNAVTMQSITANEKFDLSYFSPPQFKRTALQQMLEQLGWSGIHRLSDGEDERLPGRDRIADGKCGGLPESCQRAVRTRPSLQSSWRCRSGAHMLSKGACDRPEVQKGH
jgi:hypothetical protein